jgi:hypothetical protein
MSAPVQWTCLLHLGHGIFAGVSADFTCAPLCCLCSPSSPPLCLQELLHWQGLFKEFYSKHYSTYRQLMWQHSMSTAMLRANFPKGAKELSVSLLQVGRVWGWAGCVRQQRVVVLLSC